MLLLLSLAIAQEPAPEEVLQKLDGLRERFEVKQYGALSHDSQRYPLFAVKTKNWSPQKPSVLVTGGKVLPRLEY